MHFLFSYQRLSLNVQPRWNTLCLKKYFSLRHSVTSEQLYAFQRHLMVQKAIKHKVKFIYIVGVIVVKEASYSTTSICICIHSNLNRSLSIVTVCASSGLCSFALMTWMHSTHYSVWGFRDETAEVYEGSFFFFFLRKLRKTSKLWGCILNEAIQVPATSLQNTCDLEGRVIYCASTLDVRSWKQNRFNYLKASQSCTGVQCVCNMRQQPLHIITFYLII